MCVYISCSSWFSYFPVLHYLFCFSRDLQKTLLFTVYALSCATGGGGKHWSQSICAHFFGVRLVGQEFWLRCWG